MGHRANLIITNKDSYNLYYCHWCANVIPYDLFWGPDHAVNVIQEQRKMDKESGWLDDVWAEGGALVDPDKKVFLLYGGEDVETDIPLRRVYLKLLQHVWQGWEVRWAYNGIFDLAEYVGCPLEKVDSKLEPDYLVNLSWDPPEKKSYFNIVGSIQFEVGDDILIFPLAEDLDYLLANSPAMLDQVNRRNGYIKLDVWEWTSDFPEGGFHIDVPQKTIDIWSYDALPTDLYQKWNGWKLNFHADRFEKHITLTNGSIIFPEPDLNAILKQLWRSLLSESSNPVDNFLQWIDQSKQEGKKVEVNPLALENNRVDLDQGRRREILARAITAVKAEIEAEKKSPDCT